MAVRSRRAGQLSRSACSRQYGSQGPGIKGAVVGGRAAGQTTARDQQGRKGSLDMGVEPMTTRSHPQGTPLLL